MKKKWSFFCDAFISGKTSNLDDITTYMLDMLHMLLLNKYFNLGELVSYEIAAKLGN